MAATATISQNQMNGFLDFIKSNALPQVIELIGKAKDATKSKEAQAEMAKISDQLSNVSSLTASDFESDGRMAESIGERMHLLENGAKKLEGMSDAQDSGMTKGISAIVSQLAQMWQSAKA